jgi:hypothetical protein
MALLELRFELIDHTRKLGLAALKAPHVDGLAKLFEVVLVLVMVAVVTVMVQYVVGDELKPQFK